jgi:hypothetical protein
MKIKKVYLGRKQIYPDLWKPWENTLWYYEFTNNLNDSSWNWNNLSQAHSWFTYNTSWDLTYLTNTSWKISRQISWVNINNMTVSCWVRKTSSSTLSVVWDYGMEQGSWSNWKWTWIIVDGNNKIRIFVYTWDITSTLTASYNNWHNIVLTNNNGTSTIYLDWTNKWTTTKTFSAESTYFSLLADPHNNSNPHKWDIDSVILETKVRTDQEVLDYYNQTKSLYGIS